MAIFGCCSRFIECSDARKCVHADDPYYLRCYYRRHHLEAGRIFYGVNCNTGKRAEADPETKSVVTPPPQNNGPEPETLEIFDKSIFLHCMERVFSIYARQKNLWSIGATPEQVDTIEKAFDDAGVPYKPEIDDLNECVIDRPTEADPTPANSRVVFEVDGQEYHVLNYNSWLIKQAIAERISKAFENHYISSRVEIRGKSNTSNIYTYQTKPDQRPVTPAETQKKILPDTKETKVQKEERAAPAAVGVQASIFEICAKQLLDNLQDGSQDTQKTKPYQAREHRVLAKPSDTADPIREFHAEPGQYLIVADDKYCGAYTGEFIKLRRMQMDYRFVHIRIVDMLRPPRQDAVYNPSAPVHRDPYPAGTEQVFELVNIRLAFRQEACNA